MWVNDEIGKLPLRMIGESKSVWQLILCFICISIRHRYQHSLEQEFGLGGEMEASTVVQLCDESETKPIKSLLSSR